MRAIAAGGAIAIAAAVGFAGPAAASGGGGGFNLDITSATNLNPTSESVPLPVLQGTHNGQVIYYVVTDDSDQADAARRGVNWAPKLAHALGTAAVQIHTHDLPSLVCSAHSRLQSMACTPRA